MPPRAVDWDRLPVAASQNGDPRMSYEIEVKVADYGPNRKYLMMRYTDPVTGERKARSTGTINRREAERVAEGSI